VSLKDSGRRERGKAERRSRILRAARDLIRETGDTDLSMRALAQRADVSLSTPYNLFGSKRAVVLAVLEDERDFADRFARLQATHAIGRIFATHELSFGYYTRDPDFYRTLWRALLNTSGEAEIGLATPQRLAQTRAIWQGLIRDALKEGYLRSDLSPDLVLQGLAHVTGGALLSWAMRSMKTATLSATVGLGYGFILRGAATPKGAHLLDGRLTAYQAMLDRASPAGRERAPETL
jgi:AcrR family transcriptional regulator